MIYRRRVSMLGAGLLAALSAGLPIMTPAASAQVVEAVESQTVLVDVAVVDKDGKHVPGLTAEDFQVWEDGKEQEVDGIFTESGATSATSHFMVLLFDNSSMTAREQAQAHEAAKKFIDANTDPRRMTAVVNFGGALTVSQNFTDDSRRLKTAVDAVGVGGLAMNADPDTGRAASEIGARNTIGALRSLVENLEQASGRKSLIFFTAGFPVPSDLSGELNRTIDASNQSNVGIYPVNVQIADLQAGTGAQVTPATRGRTIQPNRGMRGAPGNRPGLFGAGGFGGAPDPQPGGENRLSDQTVMFQLAEGTGGSVVRQGDDQETLNRIGLEQSQYYFLSYTPPDSPEGSCHELRVKVNRKDVNWRARGGYCRSQPVDLLSGVAPERTLEARAEAREAGDIRASMQLPFFYTSANVARVHAALEVDPKGLEFRRKDGRYRAELQILGLAHRQDGGVAARFSDSVELAFDSRDEMEAFRQAPYRYENQFNIASGEYTLTVVLSEAGEDDNDQEGSFARLEQPLVIEPYDPSAFAMSGLALSREFHAAGAGDAGGLGIGLDDLLFDDRKSLVAGGVELIPAGSSRLPLGRQSGVYMEVYEPSLNNPGAAQQLAVAIRMRVLDRASGESRNDTGFMRLDLNGTSGNPVLPLAQALPVDGLPAGEYTLEVDVIDTRNRQAQRSVPFELE